MAGNHFSKLKLFMIPVGVFVVLILFPSSLMVAHADSDARGNDVSNTTATLVGNKIHNVTTPIGTFTSGLLTSTYTVK